MAKLLKKIEGNITTPTNSNITLYTIVTSVMLENDPFVGNDVFLIQDYSKVFNKNIIDESFNFGLNTIKQPIVINIDY